MLLQTTDIKTIYFAYCANVFATKVWRREFFFLPLHRKTKGMVFLVCAIGNINAAAKFFTSVEVYYLLIATHHHH